MQFLATQFDRLYRENPADIILLDAGHNQFANKAPIPGMLASTRKIIETARSINPRVTVLVDQVIPSEKLPKYSYISEFNAALVSLAKDLDKPDQRVILVNQAEGFDVKTDTIGDKVHPNAAGAEKMASKWFAALQSVLPAPPSHWTGKWGTDVLMGAGVPISP